MSRVTRKPFTPPLEDVAFGLSLSNAPAFCLFEKDGDCWLYRGKNHRPGKHSFVTVRYRSMPVHRALYAVEHPENPWPEHVHHACERRDCVRPDHLIGLTASQHARGHQAKRKAVAHG